MKKVIIIFSVLWCVGSYGWDSSDNYEGGNSLSSVNNPVSPLYIGTKKNN